MGIFDFHPHMCTISLDAAATLWGLSVTFFSHLSLKPLYRMHEHEHSLKESMFPLYKATNRLNKRGANMT